jgi:RecJ-like exonuclease
MFSEMEDYTSRCIECDGDGVFYVPFSGEKVCSCCHGTGMVLEDVDCQEEYLAVEVS